MSVGYVITDSQGQVVESQAADMRLNPAMAGVPSALEYVAGASLAPGEYSLKLAVADGDKIGSIEHPIHAALVDAGSLKVSELMVGGPVDAADILRPTIGYMVTYGTVHGYLEAYGPEAASLNVTYEIATDDRSPAILTAEVPARTGGEGRALFTKVMVVRALPPGKYVLRAAVAKNGQPVKTLARRFEVAPPPVLMTPAAGLSDSPSIDGELFLPIEEAALAGPFRAEDALKPATLEPFRAKLAPSAKEAFDKGRESVTTFERYIADGHADPDSLLMAIEWLYHVHAAGAFVHNRAEDLKLAHTYADQYAKAKGPKQQLVKQWLDFLEHEKR